MMSDYFEKEGNTFKKILGQGKIEVLVTFAKNNVNQLQKYLYLLANSLTIIDILIWEEDKAGNKKERKLAGDLFENVTNELNEIMKEIAKDTGGNIDEEKIS